MSSDLVFTKENLDNYLSKLAKEYRKQNGKKFRAEIILAGGAAVLANYGFREMTYDIDALIMASDSMKDAINKVGDDFNLPNGWLNSDFIKTSSYSPKLVQFSQYYKQFGYVLDVRVISGEYLIAMKLMSGRLFKNDISDVVGILKEEKNRGKIITLDDIKSAFCNLYGSWDKLSLSSQTILDNIMKSDDWEKLHNYYRETEIEARNSLIEFEDKYPNVVNKDNANDIIRNLSKKKKEKQPTAPLISYIASAEEQVKQQKNQETTKKRVKQNFEKE